MLDGGHATNALPQKASATVNCRILPEDSIDEVYKTLVSVLADDKIRVTPTHKAVFSPAPPINPEIMRAAEQAMAAMWPGVPLIPFMSVAVYDGRFLNNAGIPTYGLAGIFSDDNPGYHGLNEHIPVKSLYESREFLYRVVKTLSSPAVGLKQ